jgi:hypothetical protein
MGDKVLTVIQSLGTHLKSSGKNLKDFLAESVFTQECGSEGEESKPQEMVRASDLFQVLTNDLTTPEFIESREMNSESSVKSCMGSSLCMTEDHPNILSVDKI